MNGSSAQTLRPETQVPSLVPLRTSRHWSGSLDCAAVTNRPSHLRDAARGRLMFARVTGQCGQQRWEVEPDPTWPLSDRGSFHLPPSTCGLRACRRDGRGRRGVEASGTVFEASSFIASTHLRWARTRGVGEGGTEHQHAHRPRPASLSPSPVRPSPGLSHAGLFSILTAASPHGVSHPPQTTATS